LVSPPPKPKALLVVDPSVVVDKDSLIGTILNVEWNRMSNWNNRTYRGRVLSYDSSTDKHVVRFTDGYVRSYFVSLSKTKPNCGYFSIVSGTRVHRYNLLGQSAIPIPAPGRRIVANAAVRIIGGTHEDKTGTFLHSTEHRHRINIHGGVGARSILHKNVEVVDDARVQVVPAVWTSAHFRFQNE